MFLRDHGRRPGDKQFWNTEVAYKYKMSSMQAALGLAQLERIDELIERKREIFAWYKLKLEATEQITLNHELPAAKNGYWMVTAVIGEEHAGHGSRDPGRQVEDLHAIEHTSHADTAVR